MELKLCLKLRRKHSKQTNKAREENCTDEDLGICERDIWQRDRQGWPSSSFNTVVGSGFYLSTSLTAEVMTWKQVDVMG